MLKTFGFVLDTGRGSFTDRVSEILAGKRLPLRLVRLLLKAWAAIREQLLSVDKEALAIAAQDDTCQRMMCVRGARSLPSPSRRPSTIMAFQQLRQCRRLSPPDPAMLRLGRDRSRRQHLQMR